MEKLWHPSFANPYVHTYIWNYSHWISCLTINDSQLDLVCITEARKSQIFAIDFDHWHAKKNWMQYWNYTQLNAALYGRNTDYDNTVDHVLSWSMAQFPISVKIWLCWHFGHVRRCWCQKSLYSVRKCRFVPIGTSTAPILSHQRWKSIRQSQTNDSLRKGL